MKDLLKNKQFDAGVINGNLDASDRVDGNWADSASDALDSVAPSGLPCMTFTGAGEGVEAAIFAAMRERGSDARLSALGFEGSNHGSLALGQWSSLGWPCVAYPQSAGQEAQILESIRSAVKESREASTPIAAIVIEPTNQQTGYVASDSFISELRSVARDGGAALIVDEQSTCLGASGKGFWQYNGGADFVVFGKRMQVSGYFSTESDGTRDVNLAGSQLGLRQFSVIKDVVNSRNLIDQVDRVGKNMESQASRSAEKSSRITGVRGSGTCLWIDTADAQAASDLYAHLRENGVLTQLNGSRGVMAKPALTLADSQIGPLSSGLAKF